MSNTWWAFACFLLQSLKGICKILSSLTTSTCTHEQHAISMTKHGSILKNIRGWSGGAMVLGKLPVPGRPTIWITVGQGPTTLAVGAGGGCLDIFTLIYLFSSLSPSLWETVRYRLKYCLKGPLNPKQPTNQPKNILWILTYKTFYSSEWKEVSMSLCN